MDQPARFWDNLAERYAKQPIANLEAYEAKLSVTRTHLSPDAVVLDFGCGTGTLALNLCGDAGEIHAVDISGEMLRIAERKKAEAGVTNVTFHQGTLAGLPFADASFDVICAYNILHLLDDRIEALRRFMALLKPGGRLVTSTPCLASYKWPIRYVLPVLKWIGKAPAVQVFSVAELEDSLAAAGFVDIKQHDVSADSSTGFFVARKPD